MSRHAVLGIDIGATKVKLALVFRDGRMTGGASFPVPAGVKPAQLAAMIGERAASLSARVRTRLTGAGAGVPGHIANDRRMLIYAPNLRWKNVAFADLLENELSVPVVLENDVNAAAFGEHRYGAARGARHVICVFVGTGVGGGVIVDGKLLRGETGNSAEVGHTIFRPGGRPCNCGRSGCVEAYAGGTHIPQHYAQLGGRRGLSASEVWKLAARGNRRALRVAADATAALVMLLVNLQTVFDAGRIVLGGGVIEHLPGLYRRVKEGLKPHFAGPWKSSVRVVRSRLGANAGVLGAAALARELL